MKKNNDYRRYLKYEKSLQKSGKKNGWIQYFRIVLSVIVLVILIYASLSMKVKFNSNENQLRKDNKESEIITLDTNPVNSSVIKNKIAIQSSETENIYNNSNDVNENNIDLSLNNSNKAQDSFAIKGVYVTALAAGSNKLSKLIDIVEKTEVNALVIDVKDDYGKISYQMNSNLAKAIGSTTRSITNMEELIHTLKEKGIYLIARIVAFKDPHLAEKRKDLAIYNKDGSIYKDNRGEYWVNPYKKDVWDYLIEISSEAAFVGFDEIQFDYIRFSTGTGMNNVDFGKAAKSTTKEEIILEFTKFAYEKLRPLGVYVSADVYGTIINSSVDAALVGQNYVEMAKYLDYICPMIYPSHFGDGYLGVEIPDLDPYKIINKILLVSRSKLDQIPEGEHRAIVRPWLQDFTASWLNNYMTYGGLELRQQMKGVYDAGYEEWILWNSSCNYSVDGLLYE